MTPVQKFALKRAAATLAFVAGIFVLGESGVLKDFLADEEAPPAVTPKATATAAREPSIPGWKPWLVEISGIWSDGQTQTKIYFAPKGIFIEPLADVDASLKVQPMRPTIKGTDDDNDIVVLSASLALEGDLAGTVESVARLSGKQIPTTTEIVLQRIWMDEAHTRFNLQWTGSGGGPERLAFVRRFLPDENAQLAALVASPVQVPAAAPPTVQASAAANASPTAMAPASTRATSDGQTTSFDYVQDGVDGGIGIIAQKDGRVDAILTTVTRADSHVCQFDMTGLTKKAGFGWEWKDNDSKCSLEIGGNSSALEIHGTQGCYSKCGASGAFEGTYRLEQKTNR